MTLGDPVDCLFCGSNESAFWAEEAGWRMVRCSRCEYLYLNPRPSKLAREIATETGHFVDDRLNIKERHVEKKVSIYHKIFRDTFSDVWKSRQPIVWLDLGAGYGEIIRSIKKLAHPDSVVIGLEPMKPKVEAAKKRGIVLLEGYLSDETPPCDFVSVINVFSHIYDFDLILQQIHRVLNEGGEVYIETGDMGSVDHRSDFPGELGLPDHVAFGSERHLRGFLERNKFKIVSLQRIRADGFLFSLKCVVKRILGRDTRVLLPYSSPYRELRIRAKKISA